MNFTIPLHPTHPTHPTLTPPTLSTLTPPLPPVASPPPSLHPYTVYMTIKLNTYVRLGLEVSTRLYQDLEAVYLALVCCLKQWRVSILHH